MEQKPRPKNRPARKIQAKAAMTDLESPFDPQGSYTGNPKGGGPAEQPVQDADDL